MNSRFLRAAITQFLLQSLTCFNTGGIGPYGKPFEKRVDVLKGAVQPLWIGIDIPENIPAGSYKGSIIIRPENADPQTIRY